ncbi:MAG: hypothetical protein KC766_12390 [Myxococcales bacterium]|nr:hypothetical protein [Myxococcales bacterium]
MASLDLMPLAEVVHPRLRPLFTFGLWSNLYIVGLSAIGARYFSEELLSQQFSVRKFYVLMGWVPAGFLGLVAVYDLRYFWLFLWTGMLGVVGELIVSVAWRLFFAVPIWTYSYRSLLRGYTSELNFFPWAVGAFLFHATAMLYGSEAPRSLPQLQLSEPLILSLLGGSVGLLLWPFAFLRASHRGHFTVWRFMLFCGPIAGVAVALASRYPRYVWLMLLFSVVGFATEYLYGRIMSLFFARGLWEYNHLKIDGGHSSFVTFPLWALGGLYFFFISGWVGL